MPKPHPDNEAVLCLIAQAESFATGLQLMALALEELPKERAGAIAASATEIVLRMGQLRTICESRS
jgi:predicted nucleic acid-binding Zn ribbon protein